MFANAQTGSTSLFGGNNNQSLFGGNSGQSLFGGNKNQKTGASLFMNSPNNNKDENADEDDD